MNRYSEALALLSGLEETLNSDPPNALLLSNLLFAEGRFDEAVLVLESIDADALETDAFNKSRIERELTTRREYVELWTAEQEIRAAEAAADDLPRAEIVLERGSRIEVELFENEAPNTVANFIALSESGFYDGTAFHRVITNFMAQGGDPNTKEGETGTPGQGNPGYYLADEHQQDNARKHFTGSLAMAKTTAPNTAGSQFYLSHEPLPHLNGLHTVFGRVVYGQDEVRRIELNDRIETINILRKRDHAYEPETIPLPGQASPIPTPPVTDPVDAADDASGDAEDPVSGDDGGTP
ncbi:MAG: peptidylprolyl isomerase [Planctomycetota bacterium]